MLRAYLVTKELRHSAGTQTVLAVFSKNGDLPELTDRLHQRAAAPDGVVVVVLGRHNEQIESLSALKPRLRAASGHPGNPTQATQATQATCGQLRQLRQPIQG